MGQASKGTCVGVGCSFSEWLWAVSVEGVETMGRERVAWGGGRGELHRPATRPADMHAAWLQLRPYPHSKGTTLLKWPLRSPRKLPKCNDAMCSRLQGSPALRTLLRPPRRLHCHNHSVCHHIQGTTLLTTPPAVPSQRRLHNQNYTVYHIHEGTLPKVFDAELEPLDFADKRNIKHDIEDIYRLQNGTLGCPLPQQLVGMWGESPPIGS